MGAKEDFKYEVERYGKCHDIMSMFQLTSEVESTSFTYPSCKFSLLLLHHFVRYSILKLIHIAFYVIMGQITMVL